MADTRVLELVLKATNATGDVFKGVLGTFDDMSMKAAAVGAALTGMGAAAGKALDTATASAVSYGREVVQIQRLTGGSAEESSKLAAVFDRLGISGKSTALLMKSLSTNIEGNSAALKAAGIATEDTNGKNREASDVLRDLAEYYQNADDKTQAVAIASQVLGRNYSSLLPILAGGAEAIDKVTAAAEKNGMVLGETALKDVKAYGAAMKDNEQATKGMEIQLGLMTLPLETFKAKILGDVLQALNSLPGPLKTATGGFLMLAEGVGKTAGPILMALPGLVKLVEIFPALGTAATSVGGAFAGIGPMLASVGTWLAGIGSALAASSAAVAAFAVALGAALGVGLNWLLQKIPGYQAFWDRLVGGIMDAGRDAGKYIGRIITTIGDFFRILKGGESKLDAFQMALRENFGKGADGVIGFVSKIVKSVENAITTVKSLPTIISAAFRDLAATIKGPIDTVVAAIARLNPFMRHSPSLVDNVLAGTAVIRDAYSGLGNIAIAKPSLSMPSPSFAGMSGAAGFGGVATVKVMLDGRELNRSIAETSYASGRSGVS